MPNLNAKHDHPFNDEDLNLNKIKQVQATLNSLGFKVVGFDWDWQLDGSTIFDAALDVTIQEFDYKERFTSDPWTVTVSRDGSEGDVLLEYVLIEQRRPLPKIDGDDYLVFEEALGVLFDAFCAIALAPVGAAFDMAGRLLSQSVDLEYRLNSDLSLVDSKVIDDVLTVLEALEMIASSETPLMVDVNPADFGPIEAVKVELDTVERVIELATASDGCSWQEAAQQVAGDDPEFAAILAVLAESVLEDRLSHDDGFDPPTTAGERTEVWAVPDPTFIAPMPGDIVRPDNG